MNNKHMSLLFAVMDLEFVAMHSQCFVSESARRSMCEDSELIGKC